MPSHTGKAFLSQLSLFINRPWGKERSFLFAIKSWVVICMVISWFAIFNCFFKYLVGTLKLDISPPGEKPPYCLTSELHQVQNNVTTQARFKCVPTFCGSIIIHVFMLLFFLIEYSTFTDRLLSEHVAGYCTCANALMLGAIFFFCFRISAWFIVLNPIAATY